VAEGSAHVDENGNLLNAHWDCAVARSWSGEPVTRGPAHRSAACAAESVPIPVANTEDRSMATRQAREGFYAKFEREVDPGGKLTPQERVKRVEWAMKAHMQRMALKSAKAHRLNR
jgi:hypothetical protein